MSVCRFLPSLPFGKKCSSHISDAIDFLALSLIRCDQSSVLQHLQCGVDAACTSYTEAAGSLFQCLHHLIAMHGTLLQEIQQGVFHISAFKEAMPTPKRTFPSKRTSWSKRTFRTKKTSPHTHTEKEWPVPERVLFILSPRGRSATKFKCKTSVTLVKHADMYLLLIRYTNAIYRYR